MREYSCDEKVCCFSLSILLLNHSIQLFFPATTALNRLHIQEAKSASDRDFNRADVQREMIRRLHNTDPNAAIDPTTPPIAITPPNASTDGSNDGANRGNDGAFMQESDDSHASIGELNESEGEATSQANSQDNSKLPPNK